LRHFFSSRSYDRSPQDPLLVPIATKLRLSSQGKQLRWRRTIGSDRRLRHKGACWLGRLLLPHLTSPIFFFHSKDSLYHAFLKNSCIRDMYQYDIAVNNAGNFARFQQNLALPLPALFDNVLLTVTTCPTCCIGSFCRAKAIYDSGSYSSFECESCCSRSMKTQDYNDNHSPHCNDVNGVKQAPG
jgi:hypothetical protein